MGKLAEILLKVCFIRYGGVEMGFSIKRVKSMTQFSVNCEIVTPLFLGGANSNKAELREASIKGMLRFWWRALYGDEDYKTMRERESEIFGSTEGKSRVEISVESNLKPELKNLPKGKTIKGKGYPISIIDYLGYGFYDHQKGKGNIYKREFFEPGRKFKVKVIIDQQHMKEIEKSLCCLFKFGGLGSRSRNGFGCLNCSDFNCDINFKVERELLDFTAFSKESKLFLFETHENWVDALSEIGIAYREARLSLEDRHNFDRRGLVAKPIEAKKEKISRYAKSYFLHVNKVDEGAYQGQILYMPHRHKDDLSNYLKVYKDMNEILETKAKEVKDEF